MSEIERKWVISHLPNNIANEEIISQGYVISEGRKELRLRKKGVRCYLTAKGDGDLSREEWEVEIPLWVYEIMWPKTEGHRVEKIRYTFPINDNLVMEFDEYHGILKGLFTLEIEFPDESSAQTFVLILPNKVTYKDVTSDKRFKNKNLATRKELKSLLQ